MRRIGPLLLAVLCGCVATKQPSAQLPVTPVRRSLTESLVPLLTKNLTGQGWEATVLDSSAHGVTSENPNDAWEENSGWLVFTVQRPAGGPELLLPDEAAKVLKGVKTDLTKTIESNDGEVLDFIYGEAFRQKSLLVTYKLPGITGTAKVTIGPASDKAEETTNRLEVLLREQVGK